MQVAATNACVAILEDQHPTLMTALSKAPGAAHTASTDDAHGGLTPLHLAAQHGKVRMLMGMARLPKVILDVPAGADGNTPLTAAAEAGHLRAAKALVDAGADVNMRRIPDQRAALHIAAAAQSLELVWTALMWTQQTMQGTLRCTWRPAQARLPLWRCCSAQVPT
jgi:hypothetical protein